MAFLLRGWIENAEGEKAIWRFSLEAVGGGKRLGFSDLEALVNFLKDDISRREEER
jgi:hypothetical protein